MSDFLNLENDNNKTGNYPLFFGEDLGIFDSFNVNYPELLIADEKQRALFWKSNEIDLTRDYYDMKDAPKNIREFVIENLSFQMAGDSMANTALQTLLLPLISNSQASSLVSYWGDTEAVHADAYGRIIAQCFDDPNEIFERIKDNCQMLKRLDFLKTVFRDQSHLVGNVLLGNIKEFGPAERKQMIKFLVTMLCLEGIMFMASFTATFAVTKSTQMFNGCAKAVGLIHNDEAGSHVRNGLAFLNIIKNKEKYPEWDEMRPEIKSILDAAVRSEIEWGEHLFAKVGSIVGYNQELLKKYVFHVSKPLYDRLEIDFDFEVVEVYPFPWMDKYIDPDLMQTAQQEAQSSNYLVNATLDDVGDMEFDY
ncbi:ribonucleoside reductase beta subunit [Paraglaciecola Antarctic GD virus 1]|nr:ribonucleoside reductase beta subunit [Paraglaciecola Antarctic GD virus 1]